MCPTNKNASDKIRDNETAEEHFQNLEWWSGRHWKRRVRAAERSVAHLGRFQANLESEAPVASLIVLTCLTSHLFHFRFTDAEQYSL